MSSAHTLSSARSLYTPIHTARQAVQCVGGVGKTRRMVYARLHRHQKIERGEPETEVMRLALDRRVAYSVSESLPDPTSGRITLSSGIARSYLDGGAISLLKKKKLEREKSGMVIEK